MFRLGGLLPVGLPFARGRFLRLARYSLTGHYAEFIRVGLPLRYTCVPKALNLAANLFGREHLVDCCKAPEVEAVLAGWSASGGSLNRTRMIFSVAIVLFAR